MFTAVSIEADGVAPLVFDVSGSSTGYVLREFDPGSPRIREVTADAPNANGTVDTTALHGDRLVTLSVRMVPGASSLWTMSRALRAFTRPTLRPTLKATTVDGDELQMTVRPSELSAPVSTSFIQDVQVAFVAPAGVWESAAEHSVVIRPGSDVTDGVEFDGVEFDGVEFPVVSAPGVGEVVNAGDLDAYPIVRAFGPFGQEGVDADETVIGNLTSDRSLVFAGTAIAAGDYLEIDFRRRTILVNGDTAQSRRDRLVFPESQWWTLAPGVNEIAFRPDTFSGNAQLHVIWRDAYS